MNICHDFRYGKIIYNVLDEYVGKSFKLYGEYSQGETDLFTDILRLGDTVVEVGANIGAHTIRLAQLVGNKGKVFAFEPQRLCFQLLNGNIAINNLTNVYTYQKCVSDAIGEVIVPQLNPDDEHNWGGVSLENSIDGSGEKVGQMTLDSLDLDRCDFLKIDVEGMELNVLKGACELLEKCQPIIYLEVDRMDKKSELFSFLTEQHYKIYEHNPPMFNKDNFFNNNKDVFLIDGCHIVSFNALCIPGSKEIEFIKA